MTPNVFYMLKLTHSDNAVIYFSPYQYHRCTLVQSWLKISSITTKKTWICSWSDRTGHSHVSLGHIQSHGSRVRMVTLCAATGLQKKNLQLHRTMNTQTRQPKSHSHLQGQLVALEFTDGLVKCCNVCCTNKSIRRITVIPEAVCQRIQPRTNRSSVFKHFVLTKSKRKKTIKHQVLSLTVVAFGSYFSLGLNLSF